MKKLLLVITIITLAITTRAQELNINVIINSSNIQTSAGDKTILTACSTAIINFLNTTKFTDDTYDSQERIRGNLLITLTSIPALGQFQATAQIQSTRPIYGTGYESEVLNFIDQNFNFTYTTSQIMSFTSDNVFYSDLVSLLSFYAYMVIGMDYDTYSKLGGTKYFEKVRNIVNVAIGSATVSGPGWDQNQSTNNRYWLSENINHVQLQPFRQGLYDYYRKAMDNYQTKPADGQKIILDVLTKIQTAYNLKQPASVLIKSFFTAKSSELISIFTDAAPDIQQKAVAILKQVDPLNSEKYNNIIKT